MNFEFFDLIYKVGNHFTPKKINKGIIKNMLLHNTLLFSEQVHNKNTPLQLISYWQYLHGNMGGGVCLNVVCKHRKISDCCVMLQKNIEAGNPSAFAG